MSAEDVAKQSYYDKAKTENELIYWRNRVEDCISQFCEEYDISSLKKESQNVFNACLKYIFNHVFSVKLYKDSESIVIPDLRTKTVIDINNIELLFGILEYYIYLCDLYSKAINVMSFSAFTGIDRSVIYDWCNGVLRGNNPEYANIYKILDSERERSLSDLLISGNRPNIGLLAVLNHEKGWNLPGSTREVKHVATVESPEALTARYQSRLSDQNAVLLSDNTDDSG